jgi:bacillithiol biosynthesis cysteine-adding enzyme BshC
VTGFADAPLPLASLPGIPALARGFADGSPRVARFLPDAGEARDAEAVASRARQVLERFRPRSAERADPALVEFTSGRAAAIITGQQVGLFGGPLLSLIKALAAVRIAGEVAGRGAPAAPLFWCASEDHDLVEVTRFAIPGDGVAVEIGPDPASLRANRRPVGNIRIAEDAAALLSRAAEGLSESDADERAALLAFHEGKTYREAFVATLAWLADEPALLFADAARNGDKPDLVPLAARFVRERQEVRRILERRGADLVSSGFSLQVTNEPEVLPLFALVAGERFVLREEGSGKLRLKGAADDLAFDAEEVVANFESGRWSPSFSALSRPLATSRLYPVAAAVLGPAEIAYWAQSLPLFAWADLLPPVLVPRPLVAPLSPAVRRALSKLGLGLPDALAGEEALRSRAGAARSGTALSRLRAARERALAEVGALAPELLAIDPSLARALDATRQNVAFAFGKLEERSAHAAARADAMLDTWIRRVAAEVAPGGTLAERVYTAVPWVLRHGREGLVAPLKHRLRWDVPGLQVVEL